MLTEQESVSRIGEKKGALDTNLNICQPINLELLKDALPAEFCISDDQLLLFDRLLYNSLNTPYAVAMLHLTADFQTVQEIYQSLMCRLDHHSALAKTSRDFHQTPMKQFYTQGIVVKEENSLRYKMTELGQLGKYIASLLLQGTLETGTAAHTILGNSNTSSLRRPYIDRVAMLYHLYKSPDKLTAGVLGELLQLPSGSVHKIISSLQNAKMVDYKGVSSHSPLQSQLYLYKLKESSGDHSQSLVGTIENYIFEYLQLYKQADIYDLSKSLSLSPTRLRTYLRKMCASGIMTTRLMNGEEKSSAIKLSENGRSYIDNYINNILLVCAGDPEAIEIAHTAEQELSNNEFALRNALTIHKDCRQTTPKEALIADISAYLKENGPAQRFQLIQRFGRKIDKYLEKRYFERECNNGKIYYMIPGMKLTQYSGTSNDTITQMHKTKNSTREGKFDSIMNRLDNSFFWFSFKRDLEQFPNGRSPVNFLYHYDRDNLTGESRGSTGEIYKGKYYKTTYVLMRYAPRLLDYIDNTNLPEEVLMNKLEVILNLLIQKSSGDIQSSLLGKFYNDELSIDTSEQENQQEADQFKMIEQRVMAKALLKKEYTHKNRENLLEVITAGDRAYETVFNKYLYLTYSVNIDEEDCSVEGLQEAIDAYQWRFGMSFVSYATKVIQNYRKMYWENNKRREISVDSFDEHDSNGFYRQSEDLDLAELEDILSIGLNLSEEQKILIDLLYGFTNGVEKTQEEVAAMMNKSIDEIKQILDSAYLSLRSALV